MRSGLFAGLGGLIVFITFTACVVALFSPAWKTTGVDIFGKDLVNPTNYGLFLSCEVNGDCHWMSVSSDDQPGWFMACQWLWVLTSILMLAVAFSCFALHSQTFRSQMYFSVLTSGSILAFIFSMACVITYGCNHNNIFNSDEYPYYNWGYYIAIMASAGCLLTFCIFSLAIRCVSRAEL
jgi:magnesium-transporting ATPase (P-type)